MIENDRIIPVKIDEEMRSSYIDYSMSVIVSRALPDVRDGFKPVHRRVLFGMNELGNTSDKPTKKCARIVGEVMGKYHPHGDSSIYGTLVRLAQPWNMRYPLVDGQGNFGSIDGDDAAAMRYTEARLSKLAEEMLADIDKDTVDMQLNFDDTLKEPTVLPSRFPNLLVNGANGIAVGMATNMPTHNLGEVIDGCLAYIEREIARLDAPSLQPVTIPELMQYIKAPDFPTGGTIYGYQGVINAFQTGKGRIVIRSNADIETQNNGREHIIITELPYGVVKADLVKNIADLVEDKNIDGISDISDQSKRDIRIIIDIKKDANAQVVLNQLYKYTPLQSSFSVNNIALVKGRPKLLNLFDLISAFIEHRMEVVTRRTRFELRKAQEKAHILQGLIIAIDNIDEVVQIIRNSKTPAEAQNKLEVRFDIDNLQSKAIVDMRLSALTGLRIEELKKEYQDLLELIQHLNELLQHENLRYKLIADELSEIKDKYADPRRTQIVKTTSDFNPEDMYADDDMIITISHLGYIKRIPLSDFKSQNRGGIGSRASNARDEDFIEYMHRASMHSTMMFFTNTGYIYKLKVFQIPEGNKQAKGRAIQNLINLQKNEKIQAFINVKGLENEDYLKNRFLVFATKNGIIKKTPLQAYAKSHSFGIIAINLLENDELVKVDLTDGQSEILMASDKGLVVRFNEEKVRAVGRNATGVRGIRLGPNDKTVGMVCIDKNTNQTVLVISENGYGKKTKINDEDGTPVYRITNRGGKGIRSMKLTPKTGKLVSIDAVSDDQDLMLITKAGIAIRINIEQIRTIGRNTSGVKLIELAKRNDTLMFGCTVPKEEPENPENTENTEEQNENK